MLKYSDNMEGIVLFLIVEEKVKNVATDMD